MPHVCLDILRDGDVLTADIYIKDVFLFGTGTVLNQQRIEILKELNVSSVAIENRGKKTRSKKELFENLDKRFSYVDTIPIMRHMKFWMKDIISNIGSKDEEHY